MATLPQQLLDSLKDVAGFDEAAFRQVHQSGEQATAIRINPAKIQDVETVLQSFTTHHALSTIAPVPWSRYGFYLSQRPSFTFDPLFHAGCYYVQDASSMFLEQALQQSLDLSQPLKVLDLCAAPGGKSTHLLSLLSKESLLVSNEVIKTRVPVLKQNCMKWGFENVIVTNNDPQHFSRLEGFFDVLVVDAPCSGSGLFRRDPDAVAEWSPEAVQLCCGRQKRILADAFPALKEDGILIYSTCSYSKEEDEAIAGWLQQDLKMENIALKIEREWGIVETFAKTGAKGYRFFPDKVKGEGFYLTVFRKKTPTAAPKLKGVKLEHATAKEKEVAGRWLHTKGFDFFRAPYLHALSKTFTEAYGLLKKHASIQYAGIAIGEVLNEKLVPVHALALSTVLADTVPVVDVDYNAAILYLQRSDAFIEAKKGWNVVTYKGHNIGWINSLPNRINNYYPKDWRILNQHPRKGFEK